ncbi:efflux RND transporter periplasmic adaptor subunit [Lutimonas zeaxanthinifaciens]|uniref:efflux RND transporter periplasmic adaptor subunit n=1 Tax=Lutimonas zeaxanthinifaciens TaxID=3060215 RepID=UPI00265CF085|nr:efflux RND transporter periplasmic adaptor subunit [Lutimonas sp. YSD2104]WKK65791.1 efflux RND transporter periplasmic adaptor subunit [Lutimonas sp. YSD2104]
MKKIFPVLFVILFAASCGSGDNKSVEDVIASRDLESIRAKKSELVSEQNSIKEDIKKLDIIIAELDKSKKIPLITTFKLETTDFRHYLELQGNVTTKNLLIIYPEYSGVLSNVYVKEGQKVKKGEILARIDDGGLSQQLAQLKIQADLAKTTYERQQRLWDQKIGSEMQYLQAKSNYEAQIQAIAQLEQQVDKTIIKAPFSGTIDDVLTEQGSVVMPGQSQIMRIVNLDNMYIVTDVPEKYITNITRNKKVQVEFPVLGKKIDSKVRQVGDFINPNNRTFKVEIDLPNKDRSIKPNLTAKLKINDYSNENALLIPQSIISENASGEQYVYIISENDKENEAIAEKRVIVTGLTQGDYIEVTEGLDAGNEIIMEGARSVNDGQNVKIINQDS